MFYYLSLIDDYIKYVFVSLNENRSEIKMTPFTQKDKPPLNSRHKVATAILATCLLTTSGTSQAEPVTFTVLLIEALKSAICLPDFKSLQCLSHCGSIDTINDDFRWSYQDLSCCQSSQILWKNPLCFSYKNQIKTNR